MATLNQKLSSQWKDTANLVLGLWLAVSPWALSYAGATTPAWNAHIAGVIIAVSAIAALAAFQKWEEWVNAAPSVWLIVSPLILCFGSLTAALWNQLIVGVVVLVFAAWAAGTENDGTVKA
jgi:SPW repeat